MKHLDLKKNRLWGWALTFLIILTSAGFSPAHARKITVKSKPEGAVKFKYDYKEYAENSAIELIGWGEVEIQAIIQNTNIYELDHVELAGETVRSGLINISGSENHIIEVRVDAWGSDAEMVVFLKTKGGAVVPKYAVSLGETTGATLSAVYKDTTETFTGGEVESGKTLVVTAILAEPEKYIVSHWEDAEYNTIPSTNGKIEIEYTVTKAATLKVVLKEAYKVTFDSNITAVLQSGGGELFSGTTMVPSGTKVTFTANVPENQEIVKWMVNGESREITERNLTEKIEKDTQVEVILKEKEVVKYTVTFDATKISASDGITTGSAVSENKMLTFTAQVPDGQEVKGWIITKEGSAPATQTGNPITVEIDANTNVEVEFQDVAAEEDAYQVTLAIDPADIPGTSISAVFVGGDKDGQPFISGNKLKDGETLKVTLHGLPENYIVEGWYEGEGKMNGLEGTEVEYSVFGDNATLTVKLVQKAPQVETFAVTYGAGITAAYKEGGEVATGTNVAKDKVVVFTAQVPEGQEVEKWVVNGMDQAAAASIEVTITAATNVTVVFKAQTPVPTKCRVNFGANITAMAGISALKNGTEVNAGTRVVFMASGTAEIEKWMVNGEASTETSATLTLTINQETSVEVIFKSQTPVIEFAVNYGDGITAAYKEGGGDVATGTNVAKDKVVVFTAQVPEGQEVEKWVVNGTDQAAAASIEVTITAATNVTVSFKAQTPVIEFAVNYGAGITAAYKEGGEVATGTNVAKDKVVIFTAQVPDGKEVKGWIITKEGSAPATQTGNSITVKIDANTNVEVEFQDVADEEEDAYQITLAIDPADIPGTSLSAVFVGGDKDGQPFISGNKLKDGEKIKVTLHGLPENYTVEGWYEGKDKMNALKGTEVEYEVFGDDATLTVKLVQKDPQVETFAVTYGAGITAAYKEGGEVATGTNVAKDKVVVFTAQVPEGQEVEKWVVNGTDQAAAASIEVTITAATEVAVSFKAQTPVPTKVRVTFGNNIIAKVAGKTIESGAEVTKGTEVEFIANIGADDVIVKWIVDGEDVAAAPSIKRIVEKDIEVSLAFSTAVEDINAVTVRLQGNTLVIEGVAAPEVAVYNLLGQMLVASRETRIDFSGMPNGAYLVQVNGTVYKVVK